MSLLKECLQDFPFPDSVANILHVSISDTRFCTKGLNDFCTPCIQYSATLESVKQTLADTTISFLTVANTVSISLDSRSCETLVLDATKHMQDPLSVSISR